MIMGDELFWRRFDDERPDPFDRVKVEERIVSRQGLTCHIHHITDGEAFRRRDDPVTVQIKMLLRLYGELLVVFYSSFGLHKWL